MNRSVLLTVVCACSFCLVTPLHAQRDKRDPLTPAQQDKIAEARIEPNIRIGLYREYTDERAQRLLSLGKRTEKGRGRRLDIELQDFTALVDELTTNLDEFGDRKADIRKALKDLNESVAHWQEILQGLPKDVEADIALKDASEALGDLSDDVKRYTDELDTYFKEHKDAKGQEREEPNDPPR